MHNINIFPVKEKKTENSPDYNITFFDKDNNETLYVGGGWKKESKNGKYISIQFNKPYQNKKGYKLVEYSESKDEMTSVDPF